MKKFLMILCACLLQPFNIVAALLAAFFFAIYMAIALAIVYLTGNEGEVIVLMNRGADSVRSIIKSGFWFMFPD